MRIVRSTALHGALVCCMALNGVAKGQERLVVQWESPLLTVTARDVPILEVLAEIARVARVEMSGLHTLHGNVTIKRERAALDNVLAELIGDRPHVVTRVRQPAQGSSGIALEFPAPAPRRASSPGGSQDVPALRQVTEETWFDEAGRPVFLLHDRGAGPRQTQPDENAGR